MASESRYRLGVDVGGTFTDILLLEELSGQTWRTKVPSTPEDQSVGVCNGIDQVMSQIPDASSVQLQVINHGTTVGTNAILEQKGARVALIVTEGYKDVLQTRRSQIPGGLAGWIMWEKPEPLAPLELTVESPGRISTEGVEVRSFDEQLFIKRIQPILNDKPDAITISLLNSFANPSHEQAALRILNELLPNVPVSLSSDVLPELMEYERTVTTVANSYIKPQVALYLSNLKKALASKTKHLQILRSDGGLSSVSLASQFPVTLALSGPAGGVAGVSSVVSAHTEFKNLITLDMGGTSTDVALIENGAPRIRRETEVGDLKVRSPSVDVRTVGAGGGSLVSVPEISKALRVGPESAGAVPGPACYDKGGSRATVTDANAVLGYLPKYLLGGAFKLNLEASKKAVQNIADDLGVGLFEAAEGILKIANETMYGALRLVSVEQGYDPRDFSLVAFGGAGPLHGNAVGKLLGAFPVIVPPSPGVLCAWGDATTLLRHEVSMTLIRVLANAKIEDVVTSYDTLFVKARDVMLAEQGVPVDQQVYKYEADLRYVGQAITIPVSFDLEMLKKEGLEYLREQFELAHQHLFTYRLPSNVEIINLRIVAEEEKSEMTVRRLQKAAAPEPPSSAIQSRAPFVYEGKVHEDSPIWDRSALLCGHAVEGPCIISEMDSNTVIYPGYQAKVDHVGNLLIYPIEGAGDDAADPGSKADELDSVTVDIFESALRNARNEMDTLVTRVSMSPAIREQQDEFNVIAEPSGKMIAGQFGSFIGEFLTAWKGTIEEGDVFITNDPYAVSGAISHLNDWLVLLPIHCDGKLNLVVVAWTANFGHMTDGGGTVPGSLPTNASTIFQEGLQIPIVKLASRGVLVDGVVDLIFRNCRLPEWNRADTHALVTACRLAGKRMRELYTRFGEKQYFGAIDALLSRNRKTISNIISTTLPDKPVYFEDWIDDDGIGLGPWKVACTMSKQDGRLKFDFDGTFPQSPSSINYYLSHNMFRMFIGIYLITVFDPQTVVNDGFHDLVDVDIPKGTLLNPVRPGALSTRTHLLGRVMDLISGLFGQVTPEFMTAGGFSDSPHFMYSGFREDGSSWLLYQISFGGIPGRPIGDGMDGHSLWPGMKSVPNEYLELYYPLRLEKYSTVPDSGGPGLYRGGNAQCITYRFLCDGEVSIHDDRWLSKPWGVLGGEPGARSRKALIRIDGTVKVLGSKCDHIKVCDGDLLEYVTWGGGGWGDALKRDPETVALEVRRGLVTVEGARRYGVVVQLRTPDEPTTAFVELADTQALRETMMAEKPDSQGGPGIFNRGGTIEELAARALEETGLPAPKHPGSVKLHGPMVNLPYVKEWAKKHAHLRKDL
ncbi:putative 5-oxoprolinase [Seiridium cardinale]|uniref:5-oxoprolinase n=1 Tax=Seiridium cardinale TaxID=138064 RepID=A0ABR2Y7Z7_9PEZI